VSVGVCASPCGQTTMALQERWPMVEESVAQVNVQSDIQDFISALLVESASSTDAAEPASAVAEQDS